MLSHWEYLVPHWDFPSTSHTRPYREPYHASPRLQPIPPPLAHFITPISLTSSVSSSPEQHIHRLPAGPNPMTFKSQSLPSQMHGAELPWRSQVQLTYCQDRTDENRGLTSIDMSHG